MLELLFGTHIGGWQAMFQFWFWTILAFAGLVVFYNRIK